MATTEPSADAASQQTNFRKELLGLLNETGKSNKFAAETSRSWNDFFASITIDGVGILPLPVTPMVAAAVKPLCKVAPFGKGSETVVDTTVRRAFQMASAKVTLSETLRHAVNNMMEECMDIMGVHDKVEAVFYKLLFYDQSGHFDWHRDTVRVYHLPRASSSSDVITSLTVFSFWFFTGTVGRICEFSLSIYLCAFA